eukprot:Hpha_TRINITY_DN16332_c2_g6::TRINITY_DN16332_c2_g6_i1::g.60895::m.60895
MPWWPEGHLAVLLLCRLLFTSVPSIPPTPSLSVFRVQGLQKPKTSLSPSSCSRARILSARGGHDSVWIIFVIVSERTSRTLGTRSSTIFSSSSMKWSTKHCSMTHEPAMLMNICLRWKWVSGPPDKPWIHLRRSWCWSPVLSDFSSFAQLGWAAVRTSATWSSLSLITAFWSMSLHTLAGIEAAMSPMFLAISSRSLQFSVSWGRAARVRMCFSLALSPRQFMNPATWVRHPTLTSSRSRRNRSNACVRIFSLISCPTIWPISWREKESVRRTFHSTSLARQTYASSSSFQRSLPMAATTAGKEKAQYSEKSDSESDWGAMPAKSFTSFAGTSSRGKV